ncbi:MAG: DUF3006 domain-containing protein [Patescibacteria group bacterium]
MPITKATIDRIEGTEAVLITKTATIKLPLTLLPVNIKEGEVINITVNLDSGQTAADKATAKEILNEILKSETA